MKDRNDAMPEGLVFLNYKTAPKSTLPKAETLPTIISDEAYNSLREGDENREPLLITEAIDYPVEGTGGIYTEEFFNSFLTRLKDHPFGGNKLGHAWPERDDFFTIGGQMVKNETEKGKGTVYFKIYVPHFGFETTNFGFIRNVKAKNVHYSLVTQPSGEMRKDKNGDYKMHFVKSIGYERNDAVPYEGGAMKQQINSKQNEFAEYRKLILLGQVTDESGKSLLINGKISRPTLRSMISRADVENKSELSELMSMIEMNLTKNGGKPMDLNEAIQMVQNAAANGAINLGETFKDKIALRNADDVKNAEVVKELNERKLDIAGIDKMIAENRANANAIAKNAVSTAFGAETFEVDVNGKKESLKNAAHEYAMQKCAGKYGADLDKEINSLKDDVVMKSIRANQADPNSAVNRIHENGVTPGQVAAPAVSVY